VGAEFIFEVLKSDTYITGTNRSRFLNLPISSVLDLSFNRIGSRGLVLGKSLLVENKTLRLKLGGNHFAENTPKLTKDTNTNVEDDLYGEFAVILGELGKTVDNLDH
jgi:hypothetical protein